MQQIPDYATSSIISLISSICLINKFIIQITVIEKKLSGNGGVYLIEFEVYFTCEQFNNACNKSSTSNKGWCFPSCITTLIYHWDNTMGNNLNIPKSTDINSWTDIWLPYILKTKDRLLDGINGAFPKDIPKVLKKLKINNELHFQEIPNVYCLLEESKRLLNNKLPIPVVINVLGKKYFHQDYSGMHHAIILMGVDKNNHFRVFDPFQPKYKQYWSIETMEFLDECLSSESYMSYLIPKEIKSIRTIPYKQTRLRVLYEE